MFGVKLPTTGPVARPLVSCNAKKSGFGMTGTLQNQGKKASKRSRPSRTLQVCTPHSASTPTHSSEQRLAPRITAVTRFLLCLRRQTAACSSIQQLAVPATSRVQPGITVRNLNHAAEQVLQVTIFRNTCAVPLSVQPST